MSGALSTGLAIAGAAFGAAQDVLLSPQRGFGKFIPQVVVKESHLDNLTITRHPIETGAPISDHAYMEPAELTIHCGWAPSAPALPGPLGALVPVSQGLIAGVAQLFGEGGGYLETLYEEMLKLQAEREPITVTTGKRSYENMLIESIAVDTDERSENILMVALTFKQVIIVRTETSGGEAEEDQEQPEDTATPSEEGTAQPAEQSAPPTQTDGPAPAPPSPQAQAQQAPPPANPSARPTPDWSSPTGWRNAAGVPVEANGSPQAAPIR